MGQVVIVDDRQFVVMFGVFVFCLVQVGVKVIGMVQEYGVGFDLIVNGFSLCNISGLKVGCQVKVVIIYQGDGFGVVFDFYDVDNGVKIFFVYYLYVVGYIGQDLGCQIGVVVIFGKGVDMGCCVYVYGFGDLGVYFIGELFMCYWFQCGFRVQWIIECVFVYNCDCFFYEGIIQVFVDVNLFDFIVILI